MATSSYMEKVRSSRFLVNAKSVIDEISRMVNWNWNEWENYSQNSKLASKYVGTMKYWFNQIRSKASDITLSLAYFNDFNFANIDPIILFKNILNFLKPKEIMGFTSLRKDKIITLYLETEKAKQFLIENLVAVDDNVILYDHVFARPSSLIAYLKWLPYNINVKSIKDFLNPYISISNIQREVLRLDNILYPSGKFKIYFTLKNDITIRNIPSKFKIEDNTAFLSIPGGKFRAYSCKEFTKNSGDSISINDHLGVSRGVDSLIFVNLDVETLTTDRFDHSLKMDPVSLNVFAKDNGGVHSDSGYRLSGLKENKVKEEPSQFLIDTAQMIDSQSLVLKDIVDEEDVFFPLESVFSEAELKSILNSAAERSQFATSTHLKEQNKYIGVANGSRIVKATEENILSNRKNDFLGMKNGAKGCKEEGANKKNVIDVEKFEMASSFIKDISIAELVHNPYGYNSGGSYVMKPGEVHSIPRMDSTRSSHIDSSWSELFQEKSGIVSSENPHNSCLNNLTFDQGNFSSDGFGGMNIMSDTCSGSSECSDENGMMDISIYEKETRQLQQLINPKLFKSIKTGTKPKNNVIPMKVKKKKKKNSKRENLKYV